MSIYTRAALGLLISFVCFESCQSIKGRLAGITKPKEMSKSELMSCIKKLHWPQEEVLYMTQKGWYRYFSTEGHLPQVFVFRPDGWLSFKRGGQNCDKSFMRFVPTLNQSALPVHQDSMHIKDWWPEWRSLTDSSTTAPPDDIVLVSFWANFARPVSVWTERVDSICKADQLSLRFYRVNADPIGWSP